MADLDAAYVCGAQIWFATDGYSDRDREMFFAGVEYALFVQELRTGDPIDRPIRPENESRARMLCASLGRACRVDETGIRMGHEPERPWSKIVVAGIRRRHKRAR